MRRSVSGWANHQGRTYLGALGSLVGASLSLFLRFSAAQRLAVTLRDLRSVAQILARVLSDGGVGARDASLQHLDLLDEHMIETAVRIYSPESRLGQQVAHLPLRTDREGQTRRRGAVAPHLDVPCRRPCWRHERGCHGQ